MLCWECQVSGVRTDQGEYEADIVRGLHRVRPNTEFLADTGIARLGSGIIKVDRQGAARWPMSGRRGLRQRLAYSVKQQQVYVPLATIANKLGRMVGETWRGRAGIPGYAGLGGAQGIGIEAGPHRSFRAGSQSDGHRLSHRCHQGQVPHQLLPGQSDIHVKLVYEAGGKRLLGARSWVARGGTPHRRPGGGHSPWG